MCIAHRDQKTKKIIVDLCWQRKPRFKPSQAIGEICKILKQYKITMVHSDRYAVGYVKESFQKHGVIVEPSELSKSDLYLELQPLLISGQVELLDNDELKEQFKNLERVFRRGSKDMVSHPTWGNFHDDLSNSVAGAVVYIALNPVTNLDDMPLPELLVGDKYRTMALAGRMKDEEKAFVTLLRGGVIQKD